MRTIMEAKVLYNYHDLLLPENENIKENYLINSRRLNDYWDEYFIEDFKYQLKEIGFYKECFFYSGFYSQGDGACFIGKIHLADAIKWLGDDIDQPSKELQKVFDPTDTFELYQYSHHYCHENTIDIRYETTYIDTIAIYDEINAIAKALLDKSQNLMRKFYRILQDEYDNISSEKYILDGMQEQCFEVDSCGVIYCTDLVESH